MTRRILVLNQHSSFAVSIKRALEQIGPFEVHPFTNLDAALAFLREQPQDVALVDLTLPDASDIEIVGSLRAAQSTLAIIGSPRYDDEEDARNFLGIQAMIDMPFNARNILPLIDRAIQQARGDEPSAGSLPAGGSQQRPSGGFAPLPEGGSPPATQILDDPAPRGPADRDDTFGTRQLADEELSGSVDDEAFATRRLMTGELGEPPDDRDDSPLSTRLLDDETPDFDPSSTVTRLLDDEEVSASSQPAAGQPPEEPPGRDEARPSPHVVSDEEAGPPRPFIDDVLAQMGAVPPFAGDPEESGGDDETEFDELVRSLKTDRPARRLPDKPIEFMELILGASTVGELYGDADAPRDQAEGGSAAQQLAAEEPPVPTLEDDGTVSDLMIGISDPSFASVLSMLQGKETPAQDVFEVSEDEMREAFADFYDMDQVDAEVRRITGEFEAVEEPSPREDDRPALFAFPGEGDDEARAVDFGAMEYLEDEEESTGHTVARMVLETALGESTPAEDFSLDDLLANIEEQIPAFRPTIRPLPSWVRAGHVEETGWGGPAEQPEVLPEQFPPELETAGLFADELRQGAAATAVAKRDDVTAPFDFDETVAASAGIAGYGEDELPPGLVPVAGVVDEDDEHAEALTFPSWVQAAEQEMDETPPFDRERDAPAAEAFVLDELFPLEDLPEETGEEAAPGESAAEPPSDRMDLLHIEAPTDEDTPTDFEAIGEDFELTVDERVEDETALLEPEAAAPEAQQAVFEAPGLPVEAAIDDPHIAQLAVQLTQFSLESTAVATLLTRDGEIAAYAGDLTREDVDELRAYIPTDWNEDPHAARIRFLVLETSGKGYMLYSRLTAEDYTLSMVFEGATPLRAIRQQGKRLVEALEAVPDDEDFAAAQATTRMELQQITEQTTAVKEAVEASPRNAYGYLWLLNDPNGQLLPTVRRTVQTGLLVQLQEHGWHIDRLDVAEDYIYVLANVPGETPPNEVVDDLMQRAGQLARTQDAGIDPDSLWSDGYMIVAPGRELAAEEIQEFIAFERTD